MGEWFKARGNRDRVVLITKGGLEMGPGLKGLGRKYLTQACEASLKRLQTDYIDVYMTHRADPNVPIEETLEALQALIDAGKVRHAGCSNYTADELKAALAAAGGSRARYQVLEPYYNWIERNQYEGALEDVCAAHGLGVVTYFSLASGFLTGKYRSKEDAAGRARGGFVAKYLTPGGLAQLGVLDAVAARHGATPAQVALAWIMARPSVTAPIASATTLDQLKDILKAASVKLTPEDIASLDMPAA
jgi:aryl-alcohol dehydrogenase-like predicted oxidoreductase